MGILKDLTGQKFGRLLVIERVDSSKNNKNSGRAAYWKCVCDCGRVKNIVSSSLRYGVTKSCGCLAKEEVAARNTINAKHNMSNSRTYRIWKAMRQRCQNTNRRGYHNYGAKGIKVCDSWINSFENFLEDMGECPDGMSIERKDNAKGYSKENCVWATRGEQARNRSTNTNFTHNGITKCLTDWAKEYNINPNTLRARLIKGNWPIEKALTIPVKAS